MESIQFTIVVILFLLALGYMYEKYAASRDLKKYPAPGKLVDIGGRKLHVYCIGNDESDVTVIFDTGVGSAGALDWGIVQPQIAESAYTCSYDRAGYGWSDSGPVPRTSERLYEDLRAMLDAAKIPGPYVFVAHAFASIHVRMFVEHHPEQVAGLVFVDATHPKMRSANAPDSEVRRLKRVQLLKRFGLLRLLLPRTSRYTPGLPVDLKPAYIAAQLRNIDVVLDEAIPLFNGKFELVDSVGDIPITVISRSPLEESEREMARHELQKDMSELSSDGRHVVTETATHYPHLDEPDIVVEAIRDVLNRVAVAKNM